MTALPEISTRAIAQLVDMSRRRSGLVILAYLVLTVAAIAWSATHLRVDAGARDFMSPDLDWRQDAIALQQAFPSTDRSVLVVVDAPTPERADAVRDALRDRIAAVPDISRVSAPGGSDFFARNGLLFLDLPTLEDTATDIQQAQPFFGRLSAKPNLAGLAGLFSDAYRHAGDVEGVPLARIGTRLADALDEARARPGTRLSWQNLLVGDDPAPTRRFLVALPKPGHGTDAMVDAVRAAAAAASPRDEAGVRVRLTGEVVMQADERDGITSGIQDTIWSSLIGVAAILWFAMRTASRVAICLGSTLVGLALTTGFAVVAIGRLTLISAAFAALYIGIAIAFALHFCMRLEELRTNGLSYDEAMKETATDVGTALLLSALATAAGFFSFVPTSYVAVRELGIISGTGLLIGFFITLTLVPALLERAPKPPPRTWKVRDRGPWHVLHPRIVLAGAAFIAVAATVCLLNLRFDYNPLHLTPETDAFRTFEELLETGDAPLTAAVLVPGAQQAEALAARLSGVKEVHEARWLGSFVPEDQDAKLAIVDDLRFSVGATLPERLALDPPDA
ncbi:MAG TPA: MMPL family transporter, partial [Nevskiaceae bacterium]|nr:MMPL family transporter [Nevskiaceae bacterium]